MDFPSPCFSRKCSYDKDLMGGIDRLHPRSAVEEHNPWYPQVSKESKTTELTIRVDLLCSDRNSCIHAGNR